MKTEGDAMTAQRMWRLRMFAVHLLLVAAPLAVCHVNAVLPQVPLGTCVFRDLTGMDCPACGITRAVNATFHFQFHEAFALHPTSPVIALLALVLAGYFLATAVVGNRIQIEWRKEVAAYSRIDCWLAILLIAGWFEKLVTN